MDNGLLLVSFVHRMTAPDVPPKLPDTRPQAAAFRWAAVLPRWIWSHA